MAARAAGLAAKIHFAVDSSFHVLAAVVTAGQRADAPVFIDVMDRTRVPEDRWVAGQWLRVRPACTARR